MKFRTDKSILKFLAIGLIMIALGAILMRYFQSAASILFISSGIITLLIGIRFATAPKEALIQDERDIRINEKAGYYAFWAVMSVVSIMYILSRIIRVWDPNFIDVYSIVLFVGLYGWVVLRWHLNRKGE